jgi:FMN-dependent NADH-azoreductase
MQQRPLGPRSTFAPTSPSRKHLLAGRGTRAAVIYTSAVWGPQLDPQFGTDFQSTYLGDWLRWTGIDDITEIRYHPTLTGDTDIAMVTAREAARHAAANLGRVAAAVT